MNAVGLCLNLALGSSLGLVSRLQQPPSKEYRLVWYAVAAIVLFALGATALLGAIIWCDIHHMDFGALRVKDKHTWRVGCIPQ